MTHWRQRLAPRDLALFDGLTRDEAERFFEYLFSIPKSPEGIPKLRSQAIGLYDPFCDRRHYPLGILWQAAPYSFCDHRCLYCYGRSYLHRFSGGAVVKKGFLRAFDRCFLAMKNLRLPPRHLSMANSTDVLQGGLEKQHRAVLYMLRSLCEYPGLFSSIAVLTKNPGGLFDHPDYIETLRNLRTELQVSIAFFRDAPGGFLEPGAPTVSERRAAVEKLVKAGVPVTLRIDPLFPRDVQGCKEYQSLEKDLMPLVKWAARSGITSVISSPLKLVYRRNISEAFNRSVIAAFPEIRGNYRRMPQGLQTLLLSDLQHLCDEAGLVFQHCFKNILQRNA